MYNEKNDKEKRIWNDANQLRQKYVQADLTNNAQTMCALIVDAMRLRADHRDHPMADALAGFMSDEIRERWAAANKTDTNS